jgi:hypothetical protein
MLTNGHLVWLILFAPLLAAGAILLFTRRLPRVNEALVFLALFICGCVSSQTREQQVAARYSALMKSWFSEYYGNMTNYDALAKPFFDDFIKTRNPVAGKKWQALQISALRNEATISGKYADLLSKETPPDCYQLPFSESQIMLAALRDGYSEAARLWEAGDRKLAFKALDEKMQIVEACDKATTQWMKIHDPAGYRKRKAGIDAANSIYKSLDAQSK